MSFFGFGKNSSKEQDEAQHGGQSPATTPGTKRTTSTSGFSFSSLFGRRASQEPDLDNMNDVPTQMLRSASSTLNESIEVILGDSVALSSSLDGYTKLIAILENEDTEIELNDNNNDEHEGEIVERSERDTGTGCIQILLNLSTSHPKFVEICNNNNLIVSLVHAMRLLKIYEIKIGTLYQSLMKTNTPSSLTEAEKYLKNMGSTYKASERACNIMAILCRESSTIDILSNNKSLEKLLTYTVTSVPEKALHLQEHMSNVIRSMCSKPLNAEQVWLLHESNCIPLMVRNLKEMVSVDSSGSKSSTNNMSETNNDVLKTPSNEKEKDVFSHEHVIDNDASSPSGWSPINSGTAPSNSHSQNNSNMTAVSTTLQTQLVPAPLMLRASAAEEAGMWLAGVDCVISLICASIYVNQVLLDDFEYAGMVMIMIMIIMVMVITMMSILT